MVFFSFFYHRSLYLVNNFYVFGRAKKKPGIILSSIQNSWYDNFTTLLLRELYSCSPQIIAVSMEVVTGTPEGLRCVFNEDTVINVRTLSLYKCNYSCGSRIFQSGNVEERRQLQRRGDGVELRWVFFKIFLFIHVVNIKIIKQIYKSSQCISFFSSLSCSFCIASLHFFLLFYRRSCNPLDPPMSYGLVRQWTYHKIYAA